MKTPSKLNARAHEVELARCPDFLHETEVCNPLNARAHEVEQVTHFSFSFAKDIELLTKLSIRAHGAELIR
jgi:hypothetical protein